MGTRHLIAAVIDGEYKIAQYGQWDGYPREQGLRVLDFLKTADLESFAEKLRACTWADAKYLKKVDKDKNWPENYPELSRDTGGKILSLVMDSPVPLKLVDNLSFVAESWHCEWAYVIDVDTGALEVYRGGNTEQVPEDSRFRNVTSKDQDDSFPCTLVASFDIAELPSRSDFLLTCDPEREHEYPDGSYDLADDEVSEPEIDAEAADNDSPRPIWAA